jgi:hypothetical protein
MIFRLSVEFSSMDLHCEFHDGRQKIETCALHFIVILMYTDGFEQPVSEG